jgi:hypothetical protein
MCREHWFRAAAQISLRHHERVERARTSRAYQDAVEAARDYLGGYTRVVERVE